MKILNIHGYHGCAENSAGKVLKQLGCEVISPYIDYDSQTPEEILEYLENIIRIYSPEVICGTSLGGFYASVLSAKLNIYAMLINPCLMPFLHLPRLGYKGDIKGFISAFGILSDINVNKVSAIIGENDEIIDSHDFTGKLLGNERCKVIPDGKHSGATLPLRDFFTETISSLKA